VVLTPLRYASPVVFVFPPGSLLDRLNLYNPVGLILVNLRSLITLNTLENLVPTTVALGIIAVLGLSGWFLFHLSVPVLADRS
jgi:ABC-type polysaccharide/polyol phosphate export permease